MHMTRSNQIRLFLGALLLSLTICSVKVQAQIVDELEADIPFQFHAGNAKLPAGKYIIRVLDNTDLGAMEISTADGSAAALLEVRPTQTKSSPVKSELIFNKYGDRYFLEKLFDEYLLLKNRATLPSFNVSCRL
jgi:hypothetical protein